MTGGAFSPYGKGRVASPRQLLPEKKVSVLVVEDEALIAMDLHTILENAGYNVVALVALEKPELGLLDINLSRSDVFVPEDALVDA